MGKKPGPASKTGRRPIGPLTYAKEISDCWNYSSTDSAININHNDSSDESSKNSRPRFTTSCLLCFQQVEFLKHEIDKEEYLIILGRSKLVKNFCAQLNLNSNEIPEKCPRRVFPFCQLCESEMKLVLEHQHEIENLQHKIVTLVEKLQEKVVLGAENAGWEENDPEKFSKLRKMIIEGHHKRKGSSHHSEEEAEVAPGSNSEENSVLDNGKSLPVNRSEADSNGSSTFAKEILHEGDPKFNVVDTKPRSTGLTSVKKEKTSPSTTTGQQVESGELDDDIQQLVSRKRKLYCNGVEYFRIMRATKTEYFLCIICNYKVEIPKKRRRRGLTPTQEISLHIQTTHKLQCKRNSNRPGRKTRSSAINTTRVKIEGESRSATDVRIRQDARTSKNAEEADNATKDIHALVRNRKYKHNGLEIF